MDGIAFSMHYACGDTSVRHTLYRYEGYKISFVVDYRNHLYSLYIHVHVTCIIFELISIIHLHRNTTIHNESTGVLSLGGFGAKEAH